MYKNELEMMLSALANARKIEAEYKDELAEIDADIQEKYGKALERVKRMLTTAKADVEDYYQRVSEIALDQYKVDKIKKPNPFVTIGEYDVLEYDADKALDWCVEKEMTGALSLRKADFKKLAKAAKPDFVTFSKEPRARIATDLSEWLPEASDG